jgi:hypothetical protein
MENTSHAIATIPIRINNTPKKYLGSDAFELLEGETDALSDFIMALHQLLDWNGGERHSNPIS